VRSDALEVEPAASVYVNDPRFRVAYDQLAASPDSPALQGPILGPQREIRAITARAVAEVFAGGDVQSALSNAAVVANDLLVSYNASN
jgi:sn-glycerol 3-phosphate transport system substrate-binding protein